jgi:hypothetical protein
MQPVRVDGQRGRRMRCVGSRNMQHGTGTSWLPAPILWTVKSRTGPMHSPAPHTKRNKTPFTLLRLCEPMTSPSYKKKQNSLYFAEVVRADDQPGDVNCSRTLRLFPSPDAVSHIALHMRPVWRSRVQAVAYIVVQDKQHVFCKYNIYDINVTMTSCTHICFRGGKVELAH